MAGFSKEMQDALKADAEKLSAMTGDEHTVEFFSAPEDATAWVVMAEPDFKWHFALSKDDAEHTANNFLTYAKGCTSASIAPLFAGQPIPIAKRTY